MHEKPAQLHFDSGMAGDGDRTDDLSVYLRQPQPVFIWVKRLYEISKSAGDMGLECLVVSMLLRVQNPMEMSQMTYVAWHKRVP
jgi:hypothetical protein